MEEFFRDGDGETSGSAAPPGHGEKPPAPLESVPPTPAIERPAPKTPARTGSLAFKPDPGLPKFNHDDELLACVEPAPDEIDGVVSDIERKAYRGIPRFASFVDPLSQELVL